MVIANYQTLNFNNQELSQMQSKVKAAFDNINANLFLSGSILAGVSLTSGSNVVNHKLGRRISGYIVVSSSVASTFNDNISLGSDALQSSVTITASASTTVSLWVF